jgi:hypothetical protein
LNKLFQLWVRTLRLQTPILLAHSTLYISLLNVTNRFGWFSPPSHSGFLQYFKHPFSVLLFIALFLFYHGEIVRNITPHPTKLGELYGSVRVSKLALWNRS